MFKFYFLSFIITFHVLYHLNIPFQHVYVYVFLSILSPISLTYISYLSLIFSQPSQSYLFLMFLFLISLSLSHTHTHTYPSNKIITLSFCKLYQFLMFLFLVSLSFFLSLLSLIFILSLSLLSLISISLFLHFISIKSTASN